MVTKYGEMAISYIHRGLKNTHTRTTTINIERQRQHHVDMSLEGLSFQLSKCLVTSLCADSQDGIKLPRLFRGEVDG
jgi:hypothetical protein